MTRFNDTLFSRQPFHFKKTIESEKLAELNTFLKQEGPVPCFHILHLQPPTSDLMIELLSCPGPSSNRSISSFDLIKLQ